MVSGGSFSPGIQQLGAATWNINNGGGASAPIRFSNSPTIGGSGSGNINIATPFRRQQRPVNFTINETGGATIALMASNSNVTGTGKIWAVQAGMVDFQNSTSLGATSFAINLTGGGLESTTGTTLSTYTGTGGITLGGNMTFGGPVKWSLGDERPSPSPGSVPSSPIPAERPAPRSPDLSPARAASLST